MKKPYTISDDRVRHYVAPELQGKIVGQRDEMVRPQTVEEIEALQKQAYEEARKAGHAEGVKQGLQEIKQKANKLQAVINFLQQPLDDIDEQVEYQLTELTMLLAKHLLKKESSVDHQHIQNLLHESLQYLPLKSRDIRVRLNPADIELLKLGEVNPDQQTWQCVADASVRAGGCIIESDQSVVDASVEKRIAQLMQQLGIHSASTEETDDDSAE
jgi:flagellar assembly protein FliH